MPASTQCTSCHKADVALSACGRCKTAAYCSKECQASHWPTHKSACQRPNYILRFQIYPEEITNPPVWRTLSVPSNTPFRKLHAALQIAFSWSGTHSYEFHVHDPAYDPDAQPQDLLSIIQRTGAMDAAQLQPGGYQGNGNSQREFVHRITDDRAWTGGNYRPPVDTVHEPQWRHPQTTTKGSSAAKVWELLGKEEYQGMKMTYLYDYGDCWNHEFKVLGREAAGGKIRCVDGGGHYIAEDVGCYPGWKKLLQAYRATRPDKDQKEKKIWFETLASNCDSAGLGGDRAERWDMNGINLKLSVLS